VLLIVTSVTYNVKWESRGPGIGLRHRVIVELVPELSAPEYAKTDKEEVHDFRVLSL